MQLIDTMLYAALWLSFGAVHSLLASDTAKEKLYPVFGHGYRLAYNLFSVLHIGLVFVTGRELLASLTPPITVLQEFGIYFEIVRWTGIGIILVSLTQYDLGLFSGVKQLRKAKNGVELELLHVNGLHKYVRHPLYTGVFLYLWGGAISLFGVETALWASLYLVIGTLFEERRLTRQFGAQYVEYKKQVPRYLPLRWISH